LSTRSQSVPETVRTVRERRCWRGLLLGSRRRAQRREIILPRQRQRGEVILNAITVTGSAKNATSTAFVRFIVSADGRAPPRHRAAAYQPGDL
jgi:hypothetical protein